MLLVAIYALNATNLDNVNIKSSEDSIEILLLLDSAFGGKVKRQDSSDFTSLTFQDLHFNKNKLTTKSALIKNIEIFSQNGGVVVVFAANDFDFNFDLSVQNNANAIKITVTPKVSITQNMLSQSKTQTLEDSINAIKSQNNLISPQKVESWRYIAVICILLALVILLFIIKKRTKREANPISLFRKSPIAVSQSINIDAKNKIIVLDSKEANYILFVGVNSAFIIDKIPKNSPTSQIIREHKIAHLLKNYEQLQKA